MFSSQSGRAIPEAVSHWPVGAEAQYQSGRTMVQAVSRQPVTDQSRSQPGCTMVEAVSRRSVTTEVYFLAQTLGYVVKNETVEQEFCKYAVFPLRVPFHLCSTLFPPVSTIPPMLHTVSP
jgi:hypothetical protein